MSPHCMYEKIIDVKINPCRVSKRELKVYGFHVYLNVLYVYSLCQPSDGFYVFNLEFQLKLCGRKFIIHSFPNLICNLWLVRELLQDQHNKFCKYIYGNEPSLQSSQDGSDSEEHYVSPKKKQKFNKVTTNMA